MGYNLVRTHLLTLGPHSPGYLSRCGFRIFFGIFTPTWGNQPIWRAYFSDGLVQPPTSKGFASFFPTWLTVTGVPPRALPSAQWGVGQLSEKYLDIRGVSYTLLETNSKSHWQQAGGPKRKLVFQPSIFRWVSRRIVLNHSSLKKNP